MKTLQEIQKTIKDNNFVMEQAISGYYYCQHINRDGSATTVWSDSACEDAYGFDNAVATAWSFCEDWMSEHRAQFIKTPEEAVEWINSEDYNQLEPNEIIADLGWEEDPDNNE
mgnify:CR=1 FL=1